MRIGSHHRVLTDRELQVAELVASGFSNERIATDLNISVNTVKRHLSNMMTKLSAANRAEIVGLLRSRNGDPTPTSQ